MKHTYPAVQMLFLILKVSTLQFCTTYCPLAMLIFTMMMLFLGSSHPYVSKLLLAVYVKGKAGQSASHTTRIHMKPICLYVVWTGAG